MPLALFGLGGPEIAILLLLLLVFVPLALVFPTLAFLVLDRVPREHRTQEPALAFLMIIPLFGLVWAFFVYPRIADSLRAALAARGDSAAGDCGRGLALWACICGVLFPVPGAALVGLVLLAVFFVRAFELSARLRPPPA